MRNFRDDGLPTSSPAPRELPSAHLEGPADPSPTKIRAQPLDGGPAKVQSGPFPKKRGTE